MKHSSLVFGSIYETKVGTNKVLVKLVKIRGSREDVIVRTPAGNDIYRSPSQLKGIRVDPSIASLQAELAKLKV